MATASPARESRGVKVRPPGSVTALAGLLSLLVIGAFQGGLAMVTDPIEPLGMPTSFLDGAPVDDYFWPGMFLLGIAVAAVVTVIGLLFPWKWDWAAKIESHVGFRWPWVGAIAIGVLLLGFEIIELFVVPFHPVMHPLLVAGSLAIVLLANAQTARHRLRVEPWRPHGR